METEPETATPMTDRLLAIRADMHDSGMTAAQDLAWAGKLHIAREWHAKYKEKNEQYNRVFAGMQKIIFELEAEVLELQNSMESLHSSCR